MENSSFRDIFIQDIDLYGFAMVSLLLSYLFVGMHYRHLIICIFPTNSAVFYFVPYICF